MIAEGVLDGVDAIIGFHNKPEIPVGTIGVKEGPLMAAVGQFKAEITGVGNTCGSTAQRERSNRDGMPSDCQCPSHRCSSYFSARTSGIKRIAYRSREYMECDSRESIFEGTIRTFNKEVERKMTEQFEKMIVQTADVYGQKGSIEWILTPPVVHNDAAVTKVVKSVTEKFATVVTPEVTFRSRRFR